MKYAFKEGLNGFQRAPLAMLIAIFTITLALIILGSFTLIYTNTNSIVSSLRDRVEFEVFLNDTLDQTSTVNLQNQILKVEGVKSANYFSKADALDLFKKDFGEDVTLVVGFNPLPPSIKVELNEKFKTSEKTELIANTIKYFSGVEEVKYRKQLLKLLDERSKSFLQFSFGIGIVLLIASFFLVSNTIRLIIYAKRKIISTMRLVGATNNFIRTPFVIQGFLQGIIGGGLASLILFFSIFTITNFVGNNINEFIKIENNFYLIVVFSGIILGLLASLYSIRKFLKNQISN